MPGCAEERNQSKAGSATGVLLLSVSAWVEVRAAPVGVRTGIGTDERSVLTSSDGANENPP
jgi:hypothetical protein